MSELRKEPRQRTYKAGRIGFGGGQAVINCVIRNLSEGGACLSVESPIGIPDNFTLLFDSGEASKTCQVIWRKPKQIGVTFRDPLGPATKRD
jgi:PilZ domain